VHTPATHVSLCVQGLPSLQALPFAFAGALMHVPVAWLQVPGSWHWSGAVQATGLPAVHAPATHVSFSVQGLPSLHAVPSAFAGGLMHCPVAGLQVPGLWHWSGAEQKTDWFPVHVPATHLSADVHAFPSEHEAPSGFAEFEQVPVLRSHVPARWH
jgi:hypothetical protein